MTTTTTVERRVALVGNPNVGKSTLFNALTGRRQRVANYPGVTVSAREGDVTREGGVTLKLVDLPGAYSLHPRAGDEAIVEQVVLGDQAPDAMVVVLDASNLRRNLFLLTEVLDLGLPVVVVLNMVDEARRAGLEPPTAALREAAGVPIVETVATEGKGVDDLLRLLDEPPEPPSRVWKFSDEPLEERFSASEGQTPWKRLKSLREADPALRSQEVLGRYAWINGLLGGQREYVGTDRTERIDRFLLHPILGPVAFLVIMGLVFQSIFTWAIPVMDGIEWVFSWLAAGTTATLEPTLGGLATSLVTDGILAGVGAVVVFLPQIVILFLFLFLGLLEDTGYMARAAFLVDRPLRTVGLSGQSFIPLLSSFACAIPGILATRTIPNRFERLLAVFVAPLMTCSARIPVYVLLIAAFVPATTVAGFLNLQGLVLLGLYLAGMAAGALIAFLASRARGKGRGKLLPMVVELPPYRLPSLRHIWLKLRVRVIGDFLKRAGTVIFAVSVILWVLMTFPRLEPAPGMSEKEAAAAQISQSVAGRMGQAVEPLLRPLGYDWKIGIGLIASFAAREVFVGTMGVVYSVGGEVDEEDASLREALRRAEDPKTGKKVYSLATVFSLLVFYVFALQCGATLAVVKREANWKFAVGQLLAFGALAYVAALVTYQGLAALGYA